MKIRKFIIGGIAAFIILAVVVYYGMANAGVEVEIYTVEPKDILSFIEETAIVKAIDQRLVYSKSVGEVVKLNVDTGDTLKKGDVIAVLNTDEADLQVKSLLAKKDALVALYNESTKLPAQEIIDNAKANVRSVEILLENAKSELEKAEKLYAEGAISENNYQNALNNLRLQQEKLSIVNNELANVKKGPSENIKKQYEAQISELEYQIDILTKNMGNALIEAPIDGTILEKLVDEGTYLQAGMPLVEIGNKENLYLEADILVSEIASIDKDTSVVVYSDDFTIENINGEISKIHPKAFKKISDLGVEQNRITVEIEMSGNVDILKVGYNVNIKIITNEKENIIAVPYNTIFDYEDGDYVYVVLENRAVLQKVITGIEGEEMVEILSGLNNGDKVVVNPDKNVKNNSKLSLSTFPK